MSSRSASAVALASVVMTFAMGAAAGPNLWQRARQTRSEPVAAALDAAAAVLLKAEEAHSLELRHAYLRQVRTLLEEAKVEDAADPMLPIRYAKICSMLGDNARAGAVLEKVAKRDVEGEVRTEVYANLAIAYAHSGRTAEEIKAYDEALLTESDAGERSRLLANRAEAEMLLGDLEQADKGYRAALGFIGGGSVTWHDRAPTILWGLAVASDREGDLETAFESIKAARVEDPNDMDLTEARGWFFVPEYDAFWYHALGSWQRARATEIGAAKAEFYGHAIDLWQRYLAAAPANDDYAPLAKRRLAQCEKEQAAAAKAARARLEKAAKRR